METHLQISFCIDSGTFQGGLMQGLSHRVISRWFLKIMSENEAMCVFDETFHVSIKRVPGLYKRVPGLYKLVPGPVKGLLVSIKGFLVSIKGLLVSIKGFLVFIKGFLVIIKGFHCTFMHHRPSIQVNGYQVDSPHKRPMMQGVFYILMQRNKLG